VIVATASARTAMSALITGKVRFRAVLKMAKSPAGLGGTP